MRAMTAPDTFLSNSIKVSFFILISSKFNSSGKVSNPYRPSIWPTLQQLFSLCTKFSNLYSNMANLAGSASAPDNEFPSPRSDRAIGSLVAHGGYRRHLVEHIELLKSQSAPRVVRGSGDFLAIHQRPSPTAAGVYVYQPSASSMPSDFKNAAGATCCCFRPTYQVCSSTSAKAKRCAEVRASSFWTSGAMCEPSTSPVSTPWSSQSASAMVSI